MFIMAIAPAVCGKLLIDCYDNLKLPLAFGNSKT